MAGDPDEGNGKGNGRLLCVTIQQNQSSNTSTGNSLIKIQLSQPRKGPTTGFVGSLSPCLSQYFVAESESVESSDDELQLW